MLTPCVLFLFLLAQSSAPQSHAPLSLSTKFPPRPHFDPTAPTDGLHDNSDWWSALAQPDSDADPHIPTQERELAPPNFHILGIVLTEKMFDVAAIKLGKAQVVNRGDASTGRSQACYVSTAEDEKEEKVHLIFEQGEVNFGFYLFSGGPDWYGSDRCISSTLVSRRLATASGLRLGMTPSRVIAILGKPSTRSKTELIYSLHVTKKLSAKERIEARRSNPNLSDKDFQANYGSYDWSAGIDAKFTNSKLTFLSISMSETN
jgi:hypothetical protein